MHFVQQVSSFVIDNPEFEEMAKTSEKFLSRKTSLPEESDHLDRTVDPETQARLEALLEAAGKKQQINFLNYAIKIKSIVLITDDSCCFSRHQQAFLDRWKGAGGP